MTGPLLFGGDARRAYGARIRHYWEPVGVADHVRRICGGRIHLSWEMHGPEPDRPVCAKCERARARMVSGG